MEYSWHTAVNILNTVYYIHAAGYSEVANTPGNS